MNGSTEDHQYMGLALQLAKRGQFTARPNPMVGSVIVKDGQIVGQGWHEKFGQAHAEINAINQAGDRAKGATCYVTLEPCSHTGKTGPCAEVLIRSGIVRVVAAMSDPNPQVNGKGIEILQKAGIETSLGLMEQQARELNLGFISTFERKRPWVTLKLAMSLDGRTALSDGSSKWITGKSARLEVQRLRAGQDAIITGIGTLIADNPSLTIREDGQSDWFKSLKGFVQPTRILLDRHGKADLDSKLFQNLDDNVNTASPETWWVRQNDNLSEKGSGQSIDLSNYPNVKIMNIQSLKNLLERCASHGMNRVLVEAGHKLAGAFFQNGLVDELVIFVAPKLMGNLGKGLFELDVSNMKECPKLTLTGIRQFGDDLRLIYRL